MKKINIIVQLKNGKLSLTHHELEVEFDKNDPTHEITWWLFGELANGAFLPMIPAFPGFEWDDPTNADKNFKIAGVGAKGRSLSIIDTHTQAQEPPAKYPYTLRVFYEGDFYTFDNKNKTERHPVIINK